MTRMPLMPSPKPGTRWAVADGVSGNLKAGINGFAAGALLVVLIDSMIPEAAQKAVRVAGLVTAARVARAAALARPRPVHARARGPGDLRGQADVFDLPLFEPHAACAEPGEELWIVARDDHGCSLGEPFSNLGVPDGMHKTCHDGEWARVRDITLYQMQAFGLLLDQLAAVGRGFIALDRAGLQDVNGIARRVFEEDDFLAAEGLQIY